MKFSVLQNNLKQALSVAGYIAGRNVNLPILNNIKIQAKNGNIKLITTNLEIGVIYKLRGKIEKEGEFTIESKLINDYINLLPSKQVDVEKKDTSLKIKCGNYKTNINGQSADNFPLIPDVKGDNIYTVNINEFQNALSKVVFAASSSETRQELAGVFFDFKNKILTLAATDSYRLAEKKINISNTEIKKEDNIEEGERTCSVIIPTKTLQELLRILSNIKDNKELNGDEIKIHINDNQILFSLFSTKLFSRLIEGQYPDYQQIIPSNPKTTILVNRRELIQAVKASALFTKIEVSDISLDFPKDSNKIVISSVSSQTGESVINLDAQIEGEDNGIVVNYRYLLDGLNNIDDQEVKLEIVDNNTPCILRGNSSDNKNTQDFIYVIMTIK